MISTNDPNYLIEVYKGRIIASHRNNVPQKSVNNVIIVYDKLEFPDYGFYIGLDDSKNTGNRKMEPVNMEDARSYIDWLSEVTNEKNLKHDSSVSVPVTIKEVVRTILSEVSSKRLENMDVPSKMKSPKRRNKM